MNLFVPSAAIFRIFVVGVTHCNNAAVSAMQICWCLCQRTRWLIVESKSEV